MPAWASCVPAVLLLATSPPLTAVPRSPLQFHIFTFSVDPSGEPSPIAIEGKDGTEETSVLINGAISGSERQITYFPHPYPSLK